MERFRYDGYDHQPDSFEPQPLSEGFEVSVTGHQLFYRWLELGRRVAEHPLGNPQEGGLYLAGRALEDDVLGAVRTDLVHDPLKSDYEFKTIIYPPQAFQRSKSPPFMEVGPGQDFNEALSRIVNPQTEKIDLAAVSYFLKQRLGKEYRVSHFSNEEAVVLTNDSLQDRGQEIVLHAVETPITGTTYCFHFRSSDSDSLEQFTASLDSYGSLLQELVLSIYDSKEDGFLKQPVVYQLRPEDGLEKKLARTEKAFEMQEKALTASGILDDTPELEEQIERLLVSQRPDVSFEDIGGHEDVKEELMNVAAALERPDIFERWGTSPPRGITLAGPPGTGKTLLAKALANETKARFYNVKLGDVLHHLWGRTERLMTQLFKTAQENGPAIIFIDELESLAAARGKGATSLHDQIVSVLLTELDGLKERANNIVVIGATNRVEVVDQALLRPGRLGDIIFNVDLPQPEVREEIFSIHMRLAEERAGRALFDQGVDFSQLIALTEDYSGADIEEVVRRVLYDKATQQLRGGKDSLPLVTTEEIVAKIGSYQRTKEVKEKKRVGFSSKEQF